MRSARAALLALLIGSSCATAAEVDVLLAVEPEWPADVAPDQQGSVVLGFSTNGAGRVVAVETVSRDLPVPFAEQAAQAMLLWLFSHERVGACGFIHGRQTFLFDGSSKTPVALGSTEARVGGAPEPLVALDRVEVTGVSGSGRQAADARARAEAEDRAYWESVGPRGARAAYSVPGWVPPVPLVRIEPQFPDRPVADRVSGAVALRVIVDKRGSVAGVEVADSAPAGRYDRAAVAAMRRWRFKPATDAAGQPGAMEVCQVIDFRALSVR